MSANNQVLIRKCSSHSWLVILIDVDQKFPELSTERVYLTLEEAVEYANKLITENAVEYGIRIKLGQKLKKICSECGLPIE